MKKPTIHIGIAGACGRGASFRKVIAARTDARIKAACDINEKELPEAASRLGASETYTDFEQMLDESGIHAVIIGTPMPLHASQSIAALERGIHVLCEVPAAVSVDECRALAAACGRSSAVYMMAENYTYTKPNVLIKELCRRGLFGEPYYGEGEYIHELKSLNEITRWRRRWQTGIRGITYGTHSLGPILQWLSGDRVVRVCCEGSASHYRDPRGEPYHDDTATMLCKTERGALISVRVDMISDRPHAMTNYHLQGTDGVYESGRGGPRDRPKIWFRELSPEIRWFDLEELLEDRDFCCAYLPDMWRNAGDSARKAGHGGGDYFEICDFLDAVHGKKPPAIGIHEALDMTLPALMSQKSIVESGKWAVVPNSRAWGNSATGNSASGQEQLEMIWPESHHLDPPETAIPKGYEMRQLGQEDTASYLDLMHSTGFSDWSPETVGRIIRGVLPGGYFVVRHGITGRIVATAIANHCPSDRHPFGGELGWVAVAPAHRGKNLGKAVCSAVLRRFQQAGYRRIYLKTDDFRLPAIKLYLRLGFQPHYYKEEMRDRWGKVLQKLEWPAE